jgi:hypothetical protein
MAGLGSMVTANGSPHLSLLSIAHGSDQNPNIRRHLHLPSPPLWGMGAVIVLRRFWNTVIQKKYKILYIFRAESQLLAFHLSWQIGSLEIRLFLLGKRAYQVVLLWPLCKSAGRKNCCQPPMHVEFLIVFPSPMRFDPIATKSPVRKIPPIIISVYLCKHKLHRKNCKNIRIYLCCSLVGRWLASWGNPHWRKKIEIGGKK